MQGGDGENAGEPLTARVGQHEAGRGTGNLSSRLRAPGFVCITLGGSIMSLLLMFPIWNSILMLKNPVLLHFTGRETPAAIITACVLLLCLYVVSIMLFFRHSRKAAQSEQNMMMIANVFMTMLGALVIIISMPVRRLGMEVRAEIERKCQHGQRTHDLHNTYTKLLALRTSPECAARPSVESCTDYQPSPAAELLKVMEARYLCSGWCEPPKLQPALSPTLLQLDSQQLEQRPLSRGYRAVAFSERLRPAELEADELLAAGTPSFVYPPALFSQLSHRASCDGMSARDVHYFLLNTGDQLYYEGLFLMFISIGVGMLKLLGLCLKDNIFSKLRQSKYGATFDAAGPEERPQRYVARGVLT